MRDMEKVLDKTQTNSELFRPKGRFLVSLHGTFTGDTFVYCVPKEKLLPEADRVDADWIKMNTDPLTPSDSLIELACGEGYICQIRAENAGALGVWTYSVVHASEYQG